ncbi:NEL-type E3 ubiquitin ligase domain-containing protein [Pseudomonas sp. NPDC089422]|uniref:NEL-type E3 ubiquitin ligase domain-containing protein n=1 Tax=Pseudomonas sp. NPDC089422 TaxID=3364466 RepID=UPI0037F79DE7
MIAVPTAAVDHEVQREHDQRLAAEGRALIMLAGLFVPALGVALLAKTAWELLGEVFQGVEAWHEGDDSEALDHLLNVAGEIAMLGVTAATVTVAGRVWQRCIKVDQMVPVLLENGQTKLWDQNIQRYRGEVPATGGVRDARGIVRIGPQAWVEIEGHAYPVQQHMDGGWRLRTLHDHAPQLHDNGDGAWRLWSEQPAQWDDANAMFRRFGRRFQALDDEQIEQVMSIHGLNDAQLRRMHVLDQAPPPEWVDTVVRVRIGRHIRQLITDLRTGVAVSDISLLAQARELPGAVGLTDPELADCIWVQRRELLRRIHDRLQATDHPGTVALRRIFPSLHRRAAHALLHAAAARDVQRLLGSGRVPLRLAEAARASVQRIRVARVHEGFRLDTPQNADLARVAIAMLQHLPGAEEGVRWQLHEGSLSGPVLQAGTKGRDRLYLTHEHGRFQLWSAGNTAIGEAGELFEVLASACTGRQWAAMNVGEPIADNLRVVLGQEAGARREAIVDLLTPSMRTTWFKAPVRVGGRWGYPLSGRGQAGGSGPGRPQALFARLRAVYPGFNDAQVLTWLADTRQAGLDVHAELARLARELEALQSQLRRWMQQPDDSRIQGERQYFSNSLLSCWQRRLAQGAPSGDGNLSYRFTVYGVEPGRLPELAQIRFAHIHELSLLGMRLAEVPTGFLQAFPNLRTLELSGNQLTRLPRYLTQLDTLRELDVFNNRIVLDAEQVAALASCSRLEYVNLSCNPLGRTVSVGGMPRLSRLLMRSTGVSQLPHGLLECPELQLADLRGNRISRLPQAFAQAPEWLRRTVRLTDNPLPADQQGFLPPVPGGVEAGVTIRQRWLDTADSVSRDTLSASWEELETEADSADFFGVLARLLETADFQRSGQALADRVFAMIQALCDHTSLRHEIFSNVGESLTCQDSVTLCFSNLELRMLVWRARQDSTEADQEAALLHLGRQLWRLDEVDRIALEDIQQRRAAGGNPDEIEVGLAYRLALRTELDLPAQPSDMLFGEIAALGRAEVARARERVVAAETPDALAHDLVQREFWQEHLASDAAERFEQLDAPFQVQIAGLMADATVPEGQRMVRIGQVRDARQLARSVLMEELTLIRLAMHTTPRQ